MARNTVQFQKGLSEAEFRRRYGTEEHCRAVMFLANDRVSKFTYVEFHDSAGKMEGSAFLSTAAEVFPDKIHTMLPTTAWPLQTYPRTRAAPADAS